MPSSCQRRRHVLEGLRYPPAELAVRPSLCGLGFAGLGRDRQPGRRQFPAGHLVRALHGGRRGGGRSGCADRFVDPGGRSDGAEPRSSARFRRVRSVWSSDAGRWRWGQCECSRSGSPSASLASMGATLAHAGLRSSPRRSRFARGHDARPFVDRARSGKPVGRKRRGHGWHGRVRAGGRCRGRGGDLGHDHSGGGLHRCCDRARS